MTDRCIAGEGESERCSLFDCACVCVMFWSYFLPFPDSVANTDLVVVERSSVDVPVTSLCTCAGGESNFTC